MPTLLTIDDDLTILQFFRRTFEGLGLRLVSAATAAEGLEAFARERPDVVLLDVGLPDLGGLETFRRLHALDARVPVIFVTGSDTTATAIEAVALGAYDYLLKPPQLEQLRQAVARALEAARLMKAPAVAPAGGPAEGGTDALVGRSPAMLAVYTAVGRAAPQNVPVLLLGESGTGKELIARTVYRFSRRADRPFLAINCAALPETLLESELFGHEQGAFTGATRRHVGKFEQVNGGTLFLDEVGDMSPLTQTKILRVLQEQRFERLGGAETVQTDVRLIAATNRDLKRMVADGKFREDLYYRLNVFDVRLPPLREREDDIPLLVGYFLRRLSRDLGKEVEGIAPEAMDALRRYRWPGNVRELQSVLKRALLLTTGPVLLPEALPDEVRGADHAAAPGAAPAAFADLDDFIEQRLSAGGSDLYAEWQALTERRLFTHVLRRVQGNLSQAAKLLGIHRATLRTKVAALGIRLDEGAADETGR